MACLYGRTGRLTPQNGGFRPGQYGTLYAAYHAATASPAYAAAADAEAAARAALAAHPAAAELAAAEDACRKAQAKQAGMHEVVAKYKAEVAAAQATLEVALVAGGKQAEGARKKVEGMGKRGDATRARVSGADAEAEAAAGR